MHVKSPKQLQLVVFEAPDYQVVLCADRYYLLVLPHLEDLVNLLSVDGEACVDMLELVDSHENDCSLGEAHDQEVVVWRCLVVTLLFRKVRCEKVLIFITVRGQVFRFFLPFLLFLVT